MDNIYNIAEQIFSEEPQEPHSIQIDIVNQTDCGILFEILCILFCECVQKKLPNVLRNNRNVENFILILKQYFRSFSMDFNYERIELRDHNGEFFKLLNFQLGREYFFGIRTEFNYYDFSIPYEPGIHNANDLNAYHLLIRVRDHIYKIEFSLFR